MFNEKYLQQHFTLAYYCVKDFHIYSEHNIENIIYSYGNSDKDTVTK